MTFRMRHRWRNLPCAGGSSTIGPHMTWQSSLKRSGGWLAMVAVLAAARSFGGEGDGPGAARVTRETINSIGMKLVPIESGSFEMGVDSVPLPPDLTKGLRGVSWDRPDGNGDYDEVPVHKVTITHALLIGETEVT